MSFIRHRRATSPNKFEYRNYDSKKNFFDTSAVEAVIKLVIEYNPEAIMVININQQIQIRAAESFNQRRVSAANRVAMEIRISIGSNLSIQKRILPY